MARTTAEAMTAAMATKTKLRTQMLTKMITTTRLRMMMIVRMIIMRPRSITPS